MSKIDLDPIPLKHAMPSIIRHYRPEDLEAVQAITVEAFDGLSIDQKIESRLGILQGHDWRWRKSRQIAQEITDNADNSFTAESDGTVVGYVTPQVDRASGRGRVATLAVTAAFRGQGLGRRLVQHALDHFRALGLSFAVLDAMDAHAVGRKLYLSMGFVETARLVHYAMKLSDE